jgi:hypothetical protein
MNFQQLCSKQQLGFLCNNPLLNSFFIRGQPQSNGLNAQKPGVVQELKFPQVPFNYNSFAPASGSLPSQIQRDQSGLKNVEGDNAFFRPILKTVDSTPKTSSNDQSLLLQAPENKPIISRENSETAPLEPIIDNNIPLPNPPNSIENPVPSFPEVKPAQPTNGSEVLPIVPDIDTNIPLPNPPSSIEFPNPPPAEELDTCNKASLSSLINSTYCPQTKEFKMLDGTVLKASSIPGKYRVIGPRTIITYDYLFTRVNIHYTPTDGNLDNELAEGKVTKITCG